MRREFAARERIPRLSTSLRRHVMQDKPLIEDVSPIKLHEFELPPSGEFRCHGTLACQSNLVIPMLHDESPRINEVAPTKYKCQSLSSIPKNVKEVKAGIVMLRSRLPRRLIHADTVPDRVSAPNHSQSQGYSRTQIPIDNSSSRASLSLLPSAAASRFLFTSRSQRTSLSSGIGGYKRNFLRPYSYSLNIFPNSKFHFHQHQYLLLSPHTYRLHTQVQDIHMHILPEIPSNNLPHYFDFIISIFSGFPRIEIRDQPTPPPPPTTTTPAISIPKAHIFVSPSHTLFEFLCQSANLTNIQRNLVENLRTKIYSSFEVAVWQTFIHS